MKGTFTELEQGWREPRRRWQCCRREHCLGLLTMGVPAPLMLLPAPLQPGVQLQHVLGARGQSNVRVSVHTPRRERGLCPPAKFRSRDFACPEGSLNCPCPGGEIFGILLSPGGLAPPLKPPIYSSHSYCPSQPRSALCPWPLLVRLRPRGHPHPRLSRGSGSESVGRSRG